MSSEPQEQTADDLVDALGEALREDDEARAQLADEIVSRMDVDDATREGEAVKTRRREVLEALGVLGTGAAIGGGSFLAGTEQAAAADTSSGTVGTGGKSQDIYLDQILDESGDQVADVDDTGDVSWQRGQQVPSVDAEELFNNIPPVEDRPMVTNGNTTVNVPADFPTIQEALWSIPWFCKHEYKITVDAGDYTGEGSLYFPPTYSAKTVDGSSEIGNNPTLQGDSTTPSNVTIDSIVLDGILGFPLVQGFQFEGVDTTFGPDSQARAQGCGGRVTFADINHRGNSAVQAGIVFYSSTGQINRIDFGDGDDVNNGLNIKGGPGFAQIKGASGSTGDKVMRVQAGYGVIASGVTATGANGAMETEQGIGINQNNDEMQVGKTGGPAFRGMRTFNSPLEVQDTDIVMDPDGNNTGKVDMNNRWIQGIKFNGYNAVSEPSAPSSGIWVYYDFNDDTLKYKDSNGNVTTIA